MDSDQELLWLSEAAKRLHITYRQARYWGRKHWLPVDPDASGNLMCPSQFVDRLLEFTKGLPPTHQQAWFCRLEWIAKHGDPKEREQVRAILTQEREAQRVCTVRDIPSLVGYSRRAITDWIQQGLLAAIKIDSTYFVLAEDAKWLKSILDGLTTIEAAARLGVSVNSVQRWAVEGRLSGTKCLAHHDLRFDPQVVEALKTERDALQAAHLLAGEVYRRLHISKWRLEVWAAAGAIHYCQKGGYRWYDSGDVARLERQQQSLNEEFEWLVAPNASKRLNHKATARALSILSKTLERWAREEGLLPFFTITPPELRLTERQYLADYVLALIKFSGTTPVTIKQARAFRQQCREAGHIVGL